MATESESARYLRVRKAAKEEAAITIAANTKAAQKAKAKRLGRPPVIEGQADFYADAKKIEAQINDPDFEGFSAPEEITDTEQEV